MGPGEMEVLVEFQEQEIDTDGDGEPDTLSWFNKKESLTVLRLTFWVGSSCGKRHKTLDITGVPTGPVRSTIMGSTSRDSFPFVSSLLFTHAM